MKYAVVTGSTKGIGKSIAGMLLQEGYYVITNYHSDEKAKQDFENENIKYKDYLTIIKEDLSSYEAAELFISKVLQITNFVDCLVFSAGMTDRTPFDEIRHEVWEKAINTNINVPFYIVHGLRNNLVPNNGRIVFIGSICGVYPHAGSPVYGVSKAAVHQMAKELVKFFEKKKITVNAIVPGFINTPRQANKAPEHRKRIEDKIALHRFGEPNEIASLCKEIIYNQYINGSIIEISGGYNYY